MSKEHEWTGETCTVSHYDKNWKPIPSCKFCKRCGFVEYPYDKPCRNMKQLKIIKEGQGASAEETATALELDAYFKGAFVPDRKCTCGGELKEYITSWICRECHRAYKKAPRREAKGRRWFPISDIIPAGIQPEGKGSVRKAGRPGRT